MIDPMKLACQECGRTMVLAAGQQQQILAELVRPAQSKIIECGCGKFQFILAARRRAAERDAVNLP